MHALRAHCVTLTLTLPFVACHCADVMPSPPWNLLSPTNLLYFVESTAALKELHEETGVRLDHLQQLVQHHVN